MDQYTQAAMSYLRSKRGVRNVNHLSWTGVSELEIAKWEDQNLPHELPEDYKAFLRISNGFRMKWDLLFHGEPVQLGDMCINKLKDVQKIELDVSAKDDREPVEKYLAMKRKSPPVAAFSIDRHCRCGRVALVYSKREVGSKEAPEVWFQDLSGRWNFLSKTFIVYFRMMVAHLGLPNWQYRFTEYGMDPISTQWFHLIAPGDFTLDLNAPKTRAQAKEKGRPTSSKAAGSSGASQGGPKAKSSGSRGDGLKVGRLGRTSSVARDRIPSAGRRKKQTDSTLVRSSYRVRPSTR